MTGSHLDTQPTGGKFDGAYGVLAGLEVVRTLNEHGIETAAPVEVVVWTNEEGCRFYPIYGGFRRLSRVFTTSTTCWRARMKAASASAPSLRVLVTPVMRAPVPGRLPPTSRPISNRVRCWRRKTRSSGVVTGGQGKRSYEVMVSGQEAHAGTTPMAVRRDALQGAVRMIAEADRIALDNGPQAVATVGMVSAKPNSRNTVPGTAFFSADMRHPERGVLDAMDAEFRRVCEDIAKASGLGADIVEVSRYQPVAFDETCIAAVRAAAGRLGYSHRDIVSGAGHDACYLARVAPAGMIFIPCENGISHAEIENATPADTAAGCNVLLHAMVEFAGRP